MVESSRISSSTSKARPTGALMDSSIKGIPPAFQRFYRFTKDMAGKFCRHLSKDRSNEFTEAVAKEFK